MTKKRIGLIMVLLCCPFCYLLAQQELPKVEGWRVHSAFSTNNCIEEVEDKVWVGNNSAIYALSRSTNEIEIISRVNSLSDVNVKFIKYDVSSKTIVIGYDNLNIDLIQNGIVYNISDVLNKLIIGDKALNNITIHEGKAYLSCSFGIVVVDIIRKRLVDSYANLGPNGSNLAVNDVAFFNGRIYASSQNGIYSAPTSSLNLSDYNFWSLTKVSLYSNQMEVYRNTLYAVVDSAIQTFDGVTWNVLGGQGVDVTNDMRVSNDQLVIVLQHKIIIIDPAGNIETVAQKYATGCLVSKENDLFFLVPDQSMLRMNGTTAAIEYLAPSGPYATTVTRMTFADGKLWVAGGQVNGFGVIGGWGPKFNNNKFYKLENNSWYSFKSSTDSRIVNARDFIDVTTHPVTKNAIFGSFGYGVLEINGEQVVTVYDSGNSTLRPPNGGIPLVFVSGVAFDKDNNLWVSNSDAVNPLSVKTPGGTWKSFSFPSSSGSDGRMGFVTIDDDGNKWIFSTRAQGIYVYNSGKNVLNESDDQIKRLTLQAGEGLLPSQAVMCITKDQKGEMWVGTDQGLCIFRNPENVFKSGVNYDADQIVIKTGLVYSNFLGSTPIYCIRIDAANRKWIGTANGVWLVSPDGYTVIRNFNMSNSPLLSNIIIEIGINDETGEVFFATEKGLISYMGTATEGDDVHGDVLVYPNPVKPDYNGLIAIRGLVNNAYVKITDMKGQLVYETRANGGTATWNGLTFGGKRAATGVYLIYSTNQDGTETHVAKVVFIN